MDFGLSADQRLFCSTTREFLAKSVPLDVVRGLAATGVGFDRSWWRRGAELGWTAPLVPEHLGGGSVSGAPVADLALVASEFGRACAPGPLVTISAVLTGVVRERDRFADLLDAVFSGQTIAAWAHYEPGHGLGPAAVDTLAVPDGDGFHVRGVKDRVECGDQAEVFLVTVRGPDGPMQVLIAADAPGVTVTPTWTLDLVRRTAKVEFADVLVGRDAVVHRDPAETAAALDAQWQIAATLTAAESAGAAAHAFDLTTRWMFDRYTFGRQLASYQALKHRAAEHITSLEACQATAWAAANAFGNDPISTAEAVSVAKSYVSAITPGLLQDCVQIHGGIGVTWEHDLHLYLRRVTFGRALYGTPEEHRRRLTDLLDRKVA
ncbi:acyl-CoA dehydrogenase family protein [Nocardia mangyaensis]|uniref:acyl-CoA dehydrogenase family protein n=1 Tax=Nocardia mangyaensis TaxID=2213200 RepID=UPI002674BD7E|nr:acyl-CoA dehydrogenase family protein [Nocardia mangyaensis]MDO3646931.1 acyl-CoA dehydrogenase family protein [Nocardia mangyaensis]